MNKKIWAAVFAVLLAVSAFAGAMLAKGTRKTPVKETTVEDNEKEEKSETEAAEEKAAVTAEPEAKPVSRISELKNALESELVGYDGKWAVYVENLTSGESIEINNKKMVSASLIKLFIMADVFNEINIGNISEADVTEDLRQMITVSDNEASNRLVAKLGGGKYSDMYSDSFKNGLASVNGYAAMLGCTDTEQQRDMKDSRKTPISEQNYTSVRDCGILLGKIFRKTLVSEKYDLQMLNLLKGQTRRGKIPAALPANVVCANKTGELSDTENDVAIVFSESCDYILCVMSNDVSNTSAARKNIVNISDRVYRFFNE